MSGIIFLHIGTNPFHMNRDGATTSLWQQHVPDFSSPASSIPDQIFDVVIVGGGITGITTAWQLQQAGKKCLVAEAHTLCFGTTGGTTAHLNTFFDTDYKTIIKDFGEESAQLVARATRQALDKVKHHVESLQIDCGYSEQEGYVYAQTGEQVKQLDDIINASLKAGAAVSLPYTSKYFSSPYFSNPGAISLALPTITMCI